MDDFEKRVMRRKRPVFCKNINVNSDLLQEFKRSNLLSPEMLRHVEDETKSNAVRASHLLDCLLSCQRENAFQQMSGVLMQDYSWLVKELQSDVQGEAGNLQIDPDVTREASIIVHRKFGASKRFSELDKKEIEELIALKLQVSKEEFQAELEMVKNQLSEAREVIKKKENQTKNIQKHLKKFSTKNEARLRTNAHDMLTVAEMLQQLPDDGDSLSCLDFQMAQILGLVHKALDAKTCFEDEREKCLVLLKAPGGSSLDIVLARALEELPKQGNESALESLKAETRQNEQLQTRLEVLEKELNQYHIKTKQLQEMVKAKDTKLHILNDRVGELILEANTTKDSPVEEEPEPEPQVREPQPSERERRPKTRSFETRSGNQATPRSARSTRVTKY